VYRQKGEETQAMQEQEEVERKLAELAAHKDAYDAANAAMWHATSPSVREAFWRAVEAAHEEYMRVWNWLEAHDVRHRWNYEEKRYKQVPLPGGNIVPIEKRAV
jgi:hypothetical protein